MWKSKAVRIALKLFQKNNEGEISLLNFKIYCVVTVICGTGQGQDTQINRTE